MQRNGLNGKRSCEKLYLAMLTILIRFRFLFKSAVEQVVEQLSLIAKGRPELAPSNSLRCYGNLGAADLDLHDEEIKSVLDNLAAKDPKAGAYLKDKEMRSQSIVLACQIWTLSPWKWYRCKTNSTCVR